MTIRDVGRCCSPSPGMVTLIDLIPPPNAIRAFGFRLSGLSLRERLAHAQHGREASADRRRAKHD